MEPHWGFQDGEVPQYGKCTECPSIIRTDRLDLCTEHNEVCTGQVNVIRLRERETVR